MEAPLVAVHSRLLKGFSKYESFIFKIWNLKVSYLVLFSDWYSFFGWLFTGYKKESLLLYFAAMLTSFYIFAILLKQIYGIQIHYKEGQKHLQACLRNI